MHIGRKCLGALLLAACLATGGCANKAEEQAPVLLEPAGVELDYAQAQIMDISTITTYSSAVVPHVDELYFTVDGVVAQAHVVAGDYVKKGDVLITLDQESLLEEAQDMRETLEYTRATYEDEAQMDSIDLQLAQIDLEEMHSNGASAADIARAQADIDMQQLQIQQKERSRAQEIAEMESALAVLEEQIGQNELTAPYDGVIVSIVELRKGYSVTAYNTLVFIADESRLSLSGEFISESQIRNAHAIRALIGGKEYPLTYREADMEEYLSTVFAGGVLHTRFDFVEAPDDVQCGDYAAICIENGYREGVLAIPCNALYSDSAGRYVYRLEEDGTRVRVNVHTGVSNSLYIQITDGLEEGDSVYVKE